MFRDLYSNIQTQNILTHINEPLLIFRFVDYYTLPSNNFTLEANNVTFHHSRLMGASDIENAVSQKIIEYNFFMIYF